MENPLIGEVESESLRLALFQLEQVEDELKRRRKEHGIDYFIPNVPQLRAIQSPARIIAYVGGNRTGKTTVGGFVMAAHLSNRYPNCSCHGDWFPAQKKFHGPIKAAVCVTKFDKIEQVIEPKLMAVLPRDSIQKISRTPQGYLRRLTFKNGSVLDILTNEMDAAAFESSDWDVVWVDEPLPKSHYQGILRGLTDRSGQLWMTFTPLVEPWMKDEIVDMADGRRIDVVMADTYQNLADIHGNPILTRESVRELELSLPEDVRRTRIYGEFFHLKGVVYSEYSPIIHEKEWEYFKGDHRDLPAGQLSFGYPDPVIGILDPHDRLPHHMIWAIVDRTDWLYVDRELIFTGNLQELKKAILWTEQQAGYHVVKRLVDPNFGQKPAEVGGGRTVRQELSRFPFSVPFGLSNDDKESGRMKVKDYLHFNRDLPISITNTPRIFFHRQRCPITIRSVRNYQYDEWRGAGKDDKDPKEKEKQKDTHGADVIRYLCMSNPTFDSVMSWGKREEVLEGAPY